MAATSVTQYSEFVLASENTRWMGTIVIDLATGTGELYQASQPGPGLKVTASQKYAGGGPDVAFPFASGTSALYGSLGVHGINEFYSGLHFVDFVGGTNLGTNVMPPQMYASYRGTVDYVCKDSANVGIRVNYQDDVILFYLHLIDNPALTLGRTFAKGDLLGTLKPGTFTGESTGQGVCGGASQQGGNYHVHWGFYPTNGRFQAENCILSISTQVWTCGDKEIAPGQFLTRSGSGGGEGGGDGEGPTESVPVVNFWDYMILGLYGIAEAVASVLPPREPNQIMVAILRAAGVVLRIAYTLTNTFLNLTVLWIVLLAILFLSASAFGASYVAPPVYDTLATLTNSTAYAHVPLALNAHGKRLAKRDGAVTLEELGPERAFSLIAESLGSPGAGMVDLLESFDPAMLPREPWIYS
jgi:hypothetical protein